MSAFISTHKKLLFLFVAVVFGLISIWIFIKYQPNQKELSPTPISTSTFESPETSLPPSIVSTSTSTTQQTKTYRNTKWGFEFQYPKDWAVEENYFNNYYSKFNIRVIPTKERHTKEPVAINIVLLEFTERSFRSLEKNISEVVVDEIVGVKYEYEFSGRQEIAIILPLGNLRMIIGTDDKQYYEYIFNQILVSFKFLK